MRCPALAQIPALLLLSTVALVGCSRGGGEAASSPEPTAAVHPISGLPIVVLTVESEGKVHKFAVEVASTEAEQAKGLMFRTGMAADEGMIFPRKEARKAAFWMRNTVIPLDIIFIGPDRRILNIGAEAQPYDEAPVPSSGPVIAILELNGGRAAQLGLAPGDKVSWKAP